MSRKDEIDVEPFIASEDYEKLVKEAGKLGRQFEKDGLTTSQIRNFFGEVKQIQMKGFDENKNRFVLLKPKIRYAAARQKGKGVKDFSDIMVMAIDCVGMDEKRFERFVDFFESILAYHKVAGGK